MLLSARSRAAALGLVPLRLRRPRAAPSAAAASSAGKREAASADVQRLSWSWNGHAVSYELHCVGEDSAPAVVISHGFGSNAKHWRRLAKLVQAAGYSVFAMDYLGFGASDKPDDTVYNPQLWASQLQAFVAHVVKRPAVLIGNSIGSQIAVLAAAELPSSLCAGLVLLNCAAGMNQRNLYDDDPQLRALKPIFLLVEWLLLQERIAGFLFNRFRSKANVETILREQVYVRPAAVTPELVDLLYEPSCDAGALSCFVSVFTGDPGPRPDIVARSLTMPMAVVWGADDRWTPVDGTVANAFKQLAAERDEVTFTVIERCGHCPYDDAPQETLDSIQPFLRRTLMDKTR